MSKGGQENGNSSLEIGQSNQELISEKGKGRRKKIIMASVGVAALVVAAVIVVLVLVLDDSEASPVKRETRPMSLEDVLSGRFSSKSFNGTWASDEEILYRSTAGDVMLFNTTSQRSTVLLSSDVPVLATALDCTLSADHQYLLISHDHQKIFRHSYVARYTIVNVETKATSGLDAFGEIVLQMAVWSTVGNGIVYVARNNIYYRPSAASAAIRQITSDGQIGNLYNGIPDWVYEEEVLSSNKALWISPDGGKVAYAKFVDRGVTAMTLPVYGEPGSLDFQYTRAVQVRYPKPGTPNPLVTLHVQNLEGDASLSLDLKAPSNLANKEPILSAVAWASNDIAAAIWMNRVQNEASIVTYDTVPPYTTEIVKTLNQPGGWLELFSAPVFSRDGSKLVLVLSQDQGNGLGSYRHVALLERRQNSDIKPLTRGQFVVTDILGWNHEEDLVYYQATGANSSAQQHVYSVQAGAAAAQPRCVTCSTRTSRSDRDCLYNSAEFSANAVRYMVNCDGPEVPECMLFSEEGERLAVWERNDDLADAVRSVTVPQVEKHVFDVADGFRANVLLKLPPDLDRSGNTKYPMLVNVYGGPDSYQVVDRFNVDWGSYLATNKSIIYATIDGRGSGLRGDQLLFTLYRRLGTVEIVDQINVTRQIQEKLPYVDGSRTAIWGWSYGGFASGMALATDTEGVFKCGISVAPVTDWALYDTVYTERYMGLPTPADNLKGYEDARLISKYEGLRDKLYFLIHGTLDDNVHYQQSMLWAKMLEQKDILFRQMSYPDEDHGLGSVRPHLYHSLENFLDECFVEDE